MATTSTIISVVLPSHPSTTSSSSSSSIPIHSLSPNPGLRRHVLNESSFREAQINPSIVVIIIILTIIFFLSGCLHLLIRCLVMRHHPRRDSNAIVSITALQGQLQHLFHLHDSGVDQSFIDTLPVFFYNSVQKGLKEGADCAVCLCEFEADDRLRLLPKCSHAFHMDCIDTWLLSHSTCPLCRRGLLPDHYHDLGSNNGMSGGNFISAHHGSLGLLDGSSRSYTSSAEAETGGGGGGGAGVGRAGGSGRFTPCYYGSSARTSSADHTATATAAAARSSSVDSRAECFPGHMMISKPEKENAASDVPPPSGRSEYAGKVLAVQLGRLRAVPPAGGGGGTGEGSAHIVLDTGTSSSIHSGTRRSYSVGSYEYVLNPTSLEVFIAPTPCNKRRPPGSTPRRPTPTALPPGHRITLSECTPEDALEEYADPAMLTPFHPHNHTIAAASLPHNPLYKGYAHLNLDMSPVYDLQHHHHHHHHHRMAGPRDARLKAHDPLPLALYYCTGDHRKQTSRRAFSFRHPLNAEAVKLKMSTSRRSHSDVEAFPNINWNVDEEVAEDESHKSFSGAQLVAPSAELSHTLPGSRTGSGSGSAAAPYSLAKKTLSWLVGGKH